MTNKEFKEQLFALIEKAERVIITSHMSPDDDSIASVLSMHSVLSAQFPDKEIRIVYSNPTVDRWDMFVGFERIEWTDDIVNHVKNTDILIMLDASRHYLCSKSPERLMTLPQRVAIDHHGSQADEFTLLLQQPQYTSNAELIYRTFIEGGELRKETAEHILLGVLGDTGNFAYVRPEQSAVFELAKTLIETVATPIDEFRSRYGGIPVEIIPLLQELVKNTTHTTISGWPPVQYTFIPRAVIQAGNYSEEAISAASHIHMSQFLTRVQGYAWGFVITPRVDGTCRISGRSLPESVNIRDMFERLGIGGGHDRASGGKFQESDPEACIAKLLDWMHNNQPLIR